MKYTDPKLRQSLAAEYVLGTLHGRARARFARLLAADAALRAEVRGWERRFAGLLLRVAPVAPREVVWTSIDRAINRNTVAAAPRVVAPSSPGLWRAWALAASVACVALSAALLEQMRRPPRIETVRVEVPVPSAAPYVALLKPGTTDASYLVAMMPEKGLMKVALAGKYPEDTQQHCLELWVIDDSGAPHSLGVLPETEGETELPMPHDMPMPRTPTLAISREPRGGSPTGLPTGPVLTAGKAMRTS